MTVNLPFFLTAIVALLLQAAIKTVFRALLVMTDTVIQIIGRLCGIVNIEIMLMEVMPMSYVQCREQYNILLSRTDPDFLHGGGGEHE